MLSLCTEVDSSYCHRPERDKIRAFKRNIWMISQNEGGGKYGGWCLNTCWRSSAAAWCSGAGDVYVSVCWDGFVCACVCMTGMSGSRCHDRVYRSVCQRRGKRLICLMPALHLTPSLARLVPPRPAPPLIRIRGVYKRAEYSQDTR